MSVMCYSWRGDLSWLVACFEILEPWTVAVGLFCWINVICKACWWFSWHVELKDLLYSVHCLLVELWQKYLAMLQDSFALHGFLLVNLSFQGKIHPTSESYKVLCIFWWTWVALVVFVCHFWTKKSLTLSVTSFKSNKNVCLPTNKSTMMTVEGCKISTSFLTARDAEIPSWRLEIDWNCHCAWGPLLTNHMNFWLTQHKLRFLNF